MERCTAHQTYSLGSLEVRSCPLCKKATADAREAAYQEAQRRQEQDDDDFATTVALAEVAVEAATVIESLIDSAPADPTPSGDFSGAFDGGTSGGGGADGGW